MKTEHFKKRAEERGISPELISLCERFGYRLVSRRDSSYIILSPNTLSRLNPEYKTAITNGGVTIIVKESDYVTVVWGLPYRLQGLNRDPANKQGSLYVPKRRNFLSVPVEKPKYPKCEIVFTKVSAEEFYKRFEVI